MYVDLQTLKSKTPKRKGSRTKWCVFPVDSDSDLGEIESFGTTTVAKHVITAKKVQRIYEL